jgi:predicted DNA-binding transcriptional regulator YafY
MGRKSATETLARVMVTLLTERTITQRALAERAGVHPEALRARLLELQASGVPIERVVEGRAVLWRVAEGWFPSGTLFEGEAAHTLLRLLLRLRPSRDRDASIARLAGSVQAAEALRPAAEVIVLGVASDRRSEDCLGALERVAIERVVVRVRYQGVKDRDPRWRDVSVQRIVAGVAPYVIVWCHESGTLKNFRPERISGVMRAEAIAFHEVPPAELDRQQTEAMHGFRGGALREVSFVIREDAWPWVKDNLPVRYDALEPVEGGVRVRVTTRGGEVLERYLVGLADRVTIETAEVRRAVAELARRALAQHEDRAERA